MALPAENNMIKLNERNSQERIEAIGALYEISFPPNERMPFERVLKKCEDGSMRLLSVESESGEFLGFANITLCYDALVLNYFAIEPDMQGRGFGTEVIAELKKRYPDRSIVIDIEDDSVEADNKEQRIRRRLFYERLGFSAMPYRLSIFGVESIIMSSGREYSFEEYLDVFASAFSPWAAEHVFVI